MCILSGERKTPGPGHRAKLREHYFDGSHRENALPISESYSTVLLQERSAGGRIVEWMQVSVEKD